MIDIKTYTTPCKSRSGNYSEGSTVVQGSTTTINNAGSSVDVVKELDTTTLTDNNVLSSKRVLKEIADKGHSHDNKAVLDKLTQSVIDDSHIHANKELIDKIDQDLSTSSDVIHNSFKTKGFVAGLTGAGAGMFSDYNGKSHTETDYLLVRCKALFETLEVVHEQSVAGKWIISPAGSITCNKVETTTDYYRCYFLNDQDGKRIENLFKAGDLAQCKSFNIKSGVYTNVSNKYYWRRVVAVGDNYIDLSVSDCDTGSDVPAKDDVICQLGNVSDTSRQNAIILSSVDDNSPSVILYNGINSYSLTDKQYIEFGVDAATGKAYHKVYGDAYIGARDNSTYLKYTTENGVEIKGKLAEGTTTSDGTDINNLNTGIFNLLRNSGFTGDYQQLELDTTTILASSTDLYSNKLVCWTNSNALVSVDSACQSGYSCALTAGYITQTLYYQQIAGQSYVISVKAKGTSFTIEVGGKTITQTLTSSYADYRFKYTSGGGTTFKISGTCVISEVELAIGTIPVAWSQSPLDNHKMFDKFQAIRYVTDAIADGSVQMSGGLVLMTLLMLGNYVNGTLTKVTSGINGIYNDDDDVSFWAGGTLTQAINAVQMFKDNPSYEPTDEELLSIAHAVITHGGRAILNDVVLRGYIYAKGGVFKGKVSIGGGKTVLNEDGSGTLANGKFSFTKDGGCKLGNLEVTDFGALIGADGIYNKRSVYNPTWSDTNLSSYIADYIRLTTTFVLTPPANTSSGTKTVNLPSVTQLADKQLTICSFHVKIIAANTDNYIIPLSIVYRITSNASSSITVDNVTYPVPQGEIRDAANNRVEYIDMIAGNVLTLFYAGGVYYIQGKNF